MSPVIAAPTSDAEAAIVFVQHHASPMEAGLYRLTVTQEVELPGRGVHEAYVTQEHFAVAGPRFALTATEFDSMYPPDGSSGQYVNVLPHLVIKRRTMPWERSPLPTGVDPGRSEGVASWLALLVFDETDPPPAPRSAQIVDLVSPTVRPAGRLPAGTVSYPGLEELDFGESDSDGCRIIDVPLALFQTIAPSLRDLRWLAHGRTVSTAGKASEVGASVGGAADYAVLVGNRLPAMDRETTVHLVSLEGLASLLPPDNGGKAPAASGNAGTVRLVTLMSWRFRTEREQQGFSACLERLDAGVLRLPGMPADGDAGAAVVEEALAQGFVALDHEPRDGGGTVSWYRGPLVPHAVSRTVTPPVASADAVTAYDPALGMFDVSYAAAWQLGRLLALADRPYAAALLRWKTASRRSAAARAECAELAARMAVPVTAADPASTFMNALKAGLGVGPPQDGLVPPVGAAEPAEEPPPSTVVETLAHLRLLKGVPFSHLVPDEAMLPPESIRFVRIDRNWVDCLLDGAYSLGRFTSGDLAHDHGTGGAMQACLEAAFPGEAGAPEVSGFLLRSKAVTWWPGMSIEGRDGRGAPLPQLRFERLAPDLALCLFGGVVASVLFSEAPEGLHFGLDMPADAALDQRRFFKRLRFAASGDVAVSFRPDSLVIGAAALAVSMRDTSRVADFAAADFALEMVEGAGRVAFTLGQAPAGASRG